LHLQPIAVEFGGWYRAGHRPDSIRTCDAHLRRLGKAFGPLPLEDLTAVRIERYKRDSVRTHKPQTINNRLDCLRHCCKMAVRWGYLTRDRMQDVANLRVDEPTACMGGG
jgi:hypothetical protein